MYYYENDERSQEDRSLGMDLDDDDDDDHHHEDENSEEEEEEDDEDEDEEREEDYDLNHSDHSGHSDHALSASRKVAWSSNFHHFSNNSNNFPNTSDNLSQQPRVTSILRRDRRAAHSDNPYNDNPSSLVEDATMSSSATSGGGGYGSRVSTDGTGIPGQTNVSAGGVRGNASAPAPAPAPASTPVRSSVNEQEAVGDPPTAGRKSTCLFGSFCGICQRCRSKSQRQQQAPSQPQQQRIQRPGGNIVNRLGSQDSAANNNATPPRKTFPQRIFFFLCCWAMFLKSCVTNPSKASISRMQYLARSRWWTIVILLSTIIILFGPAFQDLWIPKEGDVVCDVLYTITFVLFCMDILIRCYVTPNYWTCNVNLWWFCCCFLKKDRSSSDSAGEIENAKKGGGPDRIKKKSSGSSGGVGGNGTSICANPLPTFQIGSFMFWCDFISTCTLIWDISYTNPVLGRMNTLNLDLDSKYMVMDGIQSLNDNVPFEVQFAILVAIARTARIARFIRASVVVKTSSRIDWYWLPDRINPYGWCRRCWGYLSRISRKSKLSDETDNESINSGVVTNNVEGDKRTILRRMSSRSSNRDGANKGPNDPVVNHMGTKKTGVLAGLMAFIGRPDKEAQRRDDAAIKIQRAFRVSRDSTYDVYGYDQSESASAGKYSEVAKKSSIVDQVKNTIRKSPSKSSGRRVDSHVGSAMRELTGQRVALGIILALVLTSLFTYFEYDSTNASTMVQLFLPTQSENDQFANRSVTVAHNTSVPDMFKYQFVDGSVRYFEISGRQPVELREREIVKITVTDVNRQNQTMGWFSQRDRVTDAAMIELASTVFILIVWFFGVTAFAGPVMMLVVTPIERMIRLLTMLMRDPLGYQNTARYKKFESEDDEFLKGTKWTKDVLKGMETSFLMSTILQIGNLMKVGFGSAGVEIIRNTLQLDKGERKDVLNLNTQGSTVSCIFLFCDIRQFTDATECLQEEVFVFTNKIAAVVHSICHSNGGSANKNVGDAFLLSWLLDDSRAMSAPHERDSSFVEPFSAGGSLLQRRISNEHRYSTSGADDDELHANNSQADKALLSVVKICMALYYNDFYTEDMSDGAKERLLEKLKKRKGPVVQMGFGLHAGKAVQGAIGSQRKLDATYIAESVEMSEYLESSTKKYGLKMLMSGDFYKLLHPTVKRRCRKIDQIHIHNQDDDASDAGDIIDEEDVMELFTYDMDIDALWKTDSNPQRGDQTETASDSEASARPTMAPGDMGTKRSKRNIMDGKSTNDRKSFGRRVSMMAMGLATSHNARDDPADAINRSGKDMNASFHMSGGQGPGLGGAGGMPGSPSEWDNNNGQQFIPRKPVLPTGPVQYNIDVWGSKELKDIRKRYAFGNFFPKFSSGLQSYYARDWEHARQCFQTILERFDDGPSRYFLKIIDENNGIPPRNFTGYGAA